MSEEMSEAIVFIGGHRIDCDFNRYGELCYCDEDYVALFRRCPECGDKLDRWGYCPNEDECELSWWWQVGPESASAPAIGEKNELRSLNEGEDG